MLALSRPASGTVSATAHLHVIAAFESPAFESPAFESPVFVDTRETRACAASTVKGALCMAPSQLLHPNERPASFRDINWLVGTLGLTHASTAVVFGDDASDNDFVAGILFLLGQSRVVIWRGDLQALLDARPRGAGRRRGLLRSRFFTGPMRDEYIALDGDVRSFFGNGSTVRLRYPQSLEPAGWLRRPPHGGPVLYRSDDERGWLLLAEDTREAVAHLARLLVERPAAKVRVHLDGLRGRSVESFGAPRAGFGAMAWLAAVLAIVSVPGVVLVARRRARRRG